jgi:hypothetical protein
MSENDKPLSDTLTDADIAEILREQKLDDTAENIELVRNSRKEAEKRLEELDKGKPAEKILTEVKITSLRKN